MFYLYESTCDDYGNEMMVYIGKFVKFLDADAFARMRLAEGRDEFVVREQSGHIRRIRS